MTWKLVTGNTFKWPQLIEAIANKASIINSSPTFASIDYVSYDFPLLLLLKLKLWRVYKVLSLLML